MWTIFAVAGTQVLRVAGSAQTCPCSRSYLINGDILSTYVAFDHLFSWLQRPCTASELQEDPRCRDAYPRPVGVSQISSRIHPDDGAIRSGIYAPTLTPLDILERSGRFGMLSQDSGTNNYALEYMHESENTVLNRKVAPKGSEDNTGRSWSSQIGWP